MFYLSHSFTVVTPGYAYSGRIRPCIPVEVDHLFQLKPTTYSIGSRPLLVGCRNGSSGWFSRTFSVTGDSVITQGMGCLVTESRGTACLQKNLHAQAQGNISPEAPGRNGPRAIARCLGISHSTVIDYLRRARAANLA